MRHHQAIYLSTGIAGLAISTTLLTTPASAKANPNSHYKQSAWTNMSALTSASDNKSTEPKNKFLTEIPKHTYTQANQTILLGFGAESSPLKKYQWIHAQDIFTNAGLGKINRKTQNTVRESDPSIGVNSTTIENKEQQRWNDTKTINRDQT